MEETAVEALTGVVARVAGDALKLMKKKLKMPHGQNL